MNLAISTEQSQPFKNSILHSNLSIIKNVPLQACFLFVGISIYAILGSPTPDNPGWWEALTALFLVMAVGGYGVKALFLPSTSIPVSLLKMLMVYGFVIVFFIGLYKDNSLPIMIRDLIAFIFILSPLVLVPVLKQYNQNAITLMKGLILLCGLSFSLRALLPFWGIVPAPEELLYLANSPLVLCSALILLGIICQVRSLFYVLGGSLLLVFPILAMLIDVQRAPISALVISFLFITLYILYKKPAIGIVVIACAVGLIAANIEIVSQIYDEILGKTQRVGLNMRYAELRAVFDALGQDPVTILFGLGWGSEFNAPSVGGLPVSYTHSFLSYVLLKGGVIGGFFATCFSIAVCLRIIAIIRENIFDGLSVFWPFVIPVLLYASHKSLDFGLIMTFIFLMIDHYLSLPENKPLCKYLKHSN